PPFAPESHAEFAVQVLTTDAPDIRQFVPNVPHGIATAIARCLRRDPRERFPSVAEFATAIAPYGSAEAQSSAQRIMVVLSRGSQPRSSNSDITDSSGDVMAGSVSGSTLSVAGTTRSVIGMGANSPSGSQKTKIRRQWGASLIMGAV